jgi:hypothetical protein
MEMISLLGYSAVYSQSKLTFQRCILPPVQDTLMMESVCTSEISVYLFRDVSGIYCQG